MLQTDTSPNQAAGAVEGKVTAVRMVTAAILQAQARGLVAAGEMDPEFARMLGFMVEEPHVDLARRVVMPAIEWAGRELMSRDPYYCQESWR